MLFTGDDIETSPLGTPCRRGSNQEDLNTTIDAPALADENYVNPKLDNINLEAVKSYSLFQKKPRKAVIDVWWLFDDGGNSIFFCIYKFTQILTNICDSVAILLSQSTLPKRYYCGNTRTYRHFFL